MGMIGRLIQDRWSALARKVLGLDALLRDLTARNHDAVAGALREGLAGFLQHSASATGVLDYHQLAYFVAAVSSAEYMIRRMAGAQKLDDRAALLSFALERAEVDGLVLEFGVYEGASLRSIAQHFDGPIHGFDSFEGLPENWTPTQRKGRFSTEGRAPAFAESRIQLHPGWFDNTLPPFLAGHAGPVRFLHVDCDIYSSTKTVLSLLADRLAAGTVIVFDEYLNYPGWQQHEFRAFRELIADSGRTYEYLGFASPGQSVALKML